MHRRESIMQAVVSALTGLATTASRVTRSRAWPVSSLPALTIAQGADVFSDQQHLGDVMRELTVEISAHAQGGSTLETDLNAISAEVYAAFMASHNLGLGYVFGVDIVSDSAPDIEGEQNETTARMSMQFNVLYEHSSTSTEA